MSETSARHGLPLLVAGQGQKDVTHNEAMILVDALLHPQVESRELDGPPANPSDGAMWLVGSAPIGDWSGHPGEFALWTMGGWRFAVPAPGTALTDRSTGRRYALADGEWSEILPRSVPPVAVAAPVSGAVVDAEARSALVALIAQLRALGFLS